MTIRWSDIGALNRVRLNVIKCLGRPAIAATVSVEGAAGDELGSALSCIEAAIAYAEKQVKERTRG